MAVTIKTIMCLRKCVYINDIILIMMEATVGAATEKSIDSFGK